MTGKRVVIDVQTRFKKTLLISPNQEKCIRECSPFLIQQESLFGFFVLLLDLLTKRFISLSIECNLQHDRVETHIF